MKPPVIETRRLKIRALALDDAVTAYSYRSLPEVYRYQSWVPNSAAEVADYINKMSTQGFNAVDTWYQLGLCLQSTGDLIGDIGLHFLPQDDEQTEIGCTVTPRYQRQGYAYEGISAVIGFLFHEMNKHRIVASVDPRNEASVLLLEKIGMRKEGHFRQSVKIRGAWEDDIQYAILRDEWPHRGA